MLDEEKLRISWLYRAAEIHVFFNLVANSLDETVEVLQI